MIIAYTLFGQDNDSYMFEHGDYHNKCAKCGIKLDFEVNPNFYFLQVINQVAFDTKKRGTRFLEYCDSCNRFRDIIGATPTYLKGIKHEITNGIYQTDLLFGSGNEKHPLTVIGTQVYDKINPECFIGVDFEEIKI